MPPQTWVELWAWARYDFGLTFEEFEELTPTGFRELSKRRNTEIKYERHAAAQSAAAIYNVNRQKVDDPILTAMDFVRTDEQAAKRERLMKAKRFINRALGTLPIMTPVEKILEKRGMVIKDLLADGYENAEQIVNEVYPHLIPSVKT